LSPANLGPEPNRPRSDLGPGIRAKLSGRGCDDLHWSTGPGSTAGHHHDATPDPGRPDPERPDPGRPGDLVGPGATWPGDLVGPGDPAATAAGGLGDPSRGAAAMAGVTRPGAARPRGSGRLGATRAQLPGSGAARTPRQRPGWYAYQVVGPAKVPPWAAEIALTIERPANPDREAAADRAGARAVGWVGGPAPALVLFRAPGRARWLAKIAEAAMEVEAAVGIRPLAGVDALTGVRAGIGSRLLPGPALPGLLPVAPAVVQASLGVAGTRGLRAPMRRWRPAAGGMDLRWRPGAGAVVTCEGPCGISAQAVVALRGLGSVATLAPPPGGALVLRAWRARATWGAALGLVLGAAETLGLGREAGRVAAQARSEDWDAVVLSGSGALDLTRAGSPGQAAPVAAAQIASGALVAALFETCLVAGGLGGAAGSQWSLAVTP
jgi:hypothetical protein